MGLGKNQRQWIQNLIKYEQFRVDDPISRALLVDRQVLEYVSNGREFFAVHPALVEVLAESA